jgi:hypothetical protein
LMSNGEIRSDFRHPSEWWWDNDWFKKAKVLAPHEFIERYGRP